VEIRPIVPDDADGLNDAFEHLSKESRYLRFLSPKPHLSARELTYLTQVDHSDHEALLAIDAMTHRVVGVARYVRARESPDEAEFAELIADEWQGRGLGRELLRALAVRAREERIGWFTALVLSQNRSMLHVLAALGEVERSPSAAGTIEVRLRLDEIADEGHSPHLAGWMQAPTSGLTSRLLDPS
jgi:RimJ/RimL family protein N-acetyltransferase